LNVYSYSVPHLKPIYFLTISVGGWSSVLKSLIDYL
jgi:hypothetical protein